VSDAYNENVRELLRDAARDLAKQTEEAKKRLNVSDETSEVCPHCSAGVLIMDNGKQCRAASGAWVTFACLTSIHAGHDPRMSQSRKCEEAERNGLIVEVAALRTANKALVERVKRLEEEMQALDHEIGNRCAKLRHWAELLVRVGNKHIAPECHDWNQAKETKP
jgi:hypothetical protein